MAAFDPLDALTLPPFCPFWTPHGAIFGISETLTKTFTVSAQASGVH
ncbi:MAG: hypothetical protein MPL62_00365 [Alphaproteobacteria bacterium]|nr:hypothetical protein [Alphaproteobacteria bacterium]